MHVSLQVCWNSPLRTIGKARAVHSSEREHWSVFCTGNPTVACTQYYIYMLPHVLFTIIDDLGFDDVGYRSGQIRTPTIDGLARDGIVLDQYYVQDVCSPSRASFLTGRYAMHHGIVDWIPPASALGLPLDETTIADCFSAAGYSTHAIGKWHVGFSTWAMVTRLRA